MPLNIGRMPASGAVVADKQPRRRAPLAWKLRNNLRLPFLKSLVAARVMAPLGQHFGLLAGIGELEISHFRFQTEAEVAAWQALCDQRAAALVAGDLDRAARLDVEIAQLEARRVRTDYGVVSRRVVTNAFVAFVVDQLQTETSVFGDFKYHDSGVGTTAEAAGDTTIETTDGESRATGTQTESASNAYRSVGTISYTSTKAITEHGLFNDATTGTLMDRSVFSAINVVSGDSVQFTYTLTLTAGG